MDIKTKKQNKIDESLKINQLSDVDDKWVIKILDFIYDNEIEDFVSLFKQIFEKCDKQILEEKDGVFQHPVVYKMFELLNDFNKSKNNIKQEMDAFEKDLKDEINKNNN